MTSPICDAVHVAASATGEVFVADGVSGILTMLRSTPDGLESEREWNVADEASLTSSSRQGELRDRVPEMLDHPQGEMTAPEFESRICDLQHDTDGRIWIRFADGDDNDGNDGNDGDDSDDSDDSELWGAIAPFGTESPTLVRFHLT